MNSGFFNEGTVFDLFKQVSGVKSEKSFKTPSSTLCMVVESWEPGSLQQEEHVPETPNGVPTSYLVRIKKRAMRTTRQMIKK